MSLWSPTHAFDHPVTLWVTAAAAGALALCPLLLIAMAHAGLVSPQTRADMRTRYLTWLVIAPCLIVPLLLGAGPAIAMVTVASVLCYREFARATGLFRHRLTSGIVALGILAIGFASLDNWYGLFIALPAWFIIALLALNTLLDQPSGYIQRTALASFAFLLFGSGLGHLGFLANANLPGGIDYRPLLLTLLACLQLNDIIAYCCGKAFGRRHLFPNTSPRKTLGGHIGATILTTALAAILLSLVFRGTHLASPRHVVALGLIISLGGQLGDLVLGSIKRDLGLKDLSALLPGHGGVSDRFNNALLVAPAIFHYLNYAAHIVPSTPARIFTGS